MYTNLLPMKIWNQTVQHWADLKITFTKKKSLSPGLQSSSECQARPKYSKIKSSRSPGIDCQALCAAGIQKPFVLYLDFQFSIRWKHLIIFSNLTLLIQLLEMKNSFAKEYYIEAIFAEPNGIWAHGHKKRVTKDQFFRLSVWWEIDTLFLSKH